MGGVREGGGMERDGGAPHTTTVTSARIEQERGRG